MSISKRELGKLRKLYQEEKKKHNFAEPIELDLYLIKKNEDIKQILDNTFAENKVEKEDLKAFNDCGLATLIDCYLSEANIEVIDEDSFESKISDAFGMYLNEIKDIPIYTKEEEKEVFLRYKEDPSVKEEIVYHNLKLVVSIAKRINSYDVPIEDIVQMGNEGLIRAIDKFDVDKGYKFSTYATWWIQRSMVRQSTDTERSLIRLPVHYREIIDKYNRYVDYYERQNGKCPTDEEIANFLGVSLKKVREYSQKNHEISTISFETPLGEERDTVLADFIPDKKHNTEEEAIRNILKEDVRKFLSESKISDREMEILSFRFGFHGGKIPTFEQLGEVYGVTRERVRQIELGALRKIRKNQNQLNKIRDYVTVEGKNRKKLL